MRWLKRDIWKVSIAMFGLLFFLVLMVWVPAPSVGAYERKLEPVSAVKATVQAAPTENATVTTLNEEKLVADIRKEDSDIFWSWTAIGTIIIGVAGVAFTIFQFLRNRRDTQDKELRDRAEERFKTAVTALGDEKEGTQVGGAILLRSFLNKEDEEIYGRYYTQIFDLAVAYLRLPRVSTISNDPDGIPHPLENPNTAVLLTPLRQALIVVFKEAFPFARNKLAKQDPSFRPQVIDVSSIQIDNAYCSGVDLEQIWMPQAFLRKANFNDANLVKANLAEANFEGTTLVGANLTEANLRDAKLARTDLTKAKLMKATLFGANLTEATLVRADFTEANLMDANLAKAILRDTNLTKATLTGRAISAWSRRSGANLEEADLRGTNLTEAILVGANLTRAFFRGVKFTGTVLIEANLTEASLVGANLKEINLKMAILTRANLEGAKLTGANLTSASLEGANLKQTNLQGAILTGAKLTNTNLEEARSLKDTDLRRVKGLTKKRLEACKAKGAIIDENTTPSLPQLTSPPTPSVPPSTTPTPSASPSSEPPIPPASAQQSS